MSLQQELINLQFLIFLPLSVFDFRSIKVNLKDEVGLANINSKNNNLNQFSFKNKIIIKLTKDEYLKQK